MRVKWMLPALLAVAAPLAAQSETLQVGDTVTVNISEQAQQVTLVIENAGFYDLFARGAEGVDPSMLLSTTNGRSLAFEVELPLPVAGFQQTDVIIPGFFAVPGTYTLEISGFGGDGSVEVSAEEASGRTLGNGQTEIYQDTLAAGGTSRQELQFTAGDVVRIATFALDDQLDVDLTLENADGVVVAENFSYDVSENPFTALNYSDAIIDGLIIPADGAYSAAVTSFADTDGEVLLLVTRFGRINASAGSAPEIFTGSVVQDGRRSFTFDATAGDVIALTVRAQGAGLDPTVTLLDPDGVPLGSNDDHGTDAADLATTDSRLNAVIPADGAYTVDVGAYSGSGDFELTVERTGVYEPLAGSSSGMVEATPEATPGS